MCKKCKNTSQCAVALKYLRLRKTEVSMQQVVFNSLHVSSSHWHERRGAQKKTFSFILSFLMAQKPALMSL